MSSLNVSISFGRVLAFAAKSFAALVIGGALVPTAQASTYQSYKEQFNCPNQSLCELNFPTLPAKREVTINDVSCKIRIGTQSVEILYADFLVQNPSDQTIVTDTSIPVLLGRNGLGSWFSLHNQTQLTYGAGAHIKVSVATDAISSMTLQCKIAGDIRALP
jgi:hypothetical protein